MFLFHTFKTVTNKRRHSLPNIPNTNWWTLNCVTFGVYTWNFAAVLLLWPGLQWRVQYPWRRRRIEGRRGRPIERIERRIKEGWGQWPHLSCPQHPEWLQCVQSSRGKVILSVCSRLVVSVFRWGRGVTSVWTSWTLRYITLRIINIDLGIPLQLRHWPGDMFAALNRV